jgi:hypothetical protein
MSDQELLEKLQKLPKEKREWVENLIGKLSTDVEAGSTTRKAGFAKGLIKILPGFDDPIEGMEDLYE